MTSSTFDQIRNECLRGGTLYEDPDFQCVQQSVFYDESPPINFIWKRPHEITCDPKFLSLTGSNKVPLPFEKIVGKLGDPWFVSAISLLYQSKGLFYRVVPADQSFEGHEYAGIFRFRIWWFGQWQEVIVDDRLPINPVTNRPIFIQPLYSTVYWPALLEKAFAKLHGSYEALKYGTSAELLADLTGGTTEIFDLTCDPMSNRSLIQQLISVSSIVTAVVSGDAADDTHTNSHNNLSPSLSRVPLPQSNHQDDLGQRDLLFHYRNNSSSQFKLNRHAHRTGPHDYSTHEAQEVESSKHRHQQEVSPGERVATSRSYFYPAPASSHNVNGKSAHQSDPGKLLRSRHNHKSSSSCSSSDGESITSSPEAKCVTGRSGGGGCGGGGVDHPLGMSGRSPGKMCERESATRHYNTSNCALSIASSSSGNSSDNTRGASLMGEESFHRLPCGLIASINYRITAVERVEIINGVDSNGIGSKENIYLVRLVNPMANLSKYTGTFASRSDHRWSRVTSKDRIKINSIDDESDIVDDIDDIYHDPRHQHHIQQHHHQQQQAVWQNKNSKNGGINGGNRFAQTNIIYDRSAESVFTSSPSTMSNCSLSASCTPPTAVSAFWIEWSDFVKYFTHLEIIYLDGETSRDEPSLRSNFAMTVKLFRGIWRKGITAGGCRNHQDTFHLNPQIEVTIGPDAEDLLVICLNQHSILEPQVVGFSLYKLNNNDNHTNSNNNNVSSHLGAKEIGDSSSPISSSASFSSSSSCKSPASTGNKSSTGLKLDRNFFKKNKSLINSSYSNSRQVVLRCALNRGTYLLLPTSFECGYEGLFSVRIYSMKGIRLRILDSPNYMSKSAIIKSPASFNDKFTQYELMFMHLADEHNTVNAFELADLLVSSLPNDYVKSCATLDVARMIVTALDTNGFGRIHIKDYKSIMCSLRYWQNIFKNHTKGTSGILRVEKLEDALNDIGFTLSTEVASRLILKYMRKDSTLRFGDFVSAVLQLTIAFTSYEKYIRENNCKQVFKKCTDETVSSSSSSLSHPSCISSSFLSAPSTATFTLTDWLRVSLQT